MSWFKRYWASTVAIGATIGWMAVTMVFLGSSDPPAPDSGLLPVPFLGHFALFGILGFLASVSTATVARSRTWLVDLGGAVLVGVLWGIFTEWYQTTVPGRDSNLEDLLTDVVGAGAGGMAAGVLRMWAAHRHGAM